jgi:hypothetical protein
VSSRNKIKRQRLAGCIISLGSLWLFFDNT